MEWDDAVTAAADQPEAERAERAEAAEGVAGFDRSLTSLWTCSCCGVGASIGDPAGLGDQCRPVVARVAAERRANEMIGDRSRLELARAFVERRDS